MPEAIDAETLVIFAPTWLSREIDEHIKNIAADTEVSEQRVVEEWRELAQHIHFYEPEIRNTNKHADCADPDDLPYKLAIVCAALGKNDQAFAWLEKAFEEHTPRLLLFLNSDPRVDPLRSDPRFQDLLRRIGLPP